MSNIKPNPVFIPTPGEPIPASKPDRYVTGFPVWDNHGTLADQRIAQALADLKRERLDYDRRKRAERRERLGRLCRTCKGKSVEWKIGRCPTCDNTGQRR